MDGGSVGDVEKGWAGWWVCRGSDERVKVAECGSLGVGEGD